MTRRKRRRKPRSEHWRLDASSKGFSDRASSDSESVWWPLTKVTDPLIQWGNHLYIRLRGSSCFQTAQLLQELVS